MKNTKKVVRQALGLSIWERAIYFVTSWKFWLILYAALVSPLILLGIYAAYLGELAWYEPLKLCGAAIVVYAGIAMFVSLFFTKRFAWLNSIDEKVMAYEILMPFTDFVTVDSAAERVFTTKFWETKLVGVSASHKYAEANKINGGWFNCHYMKFHRALMMTNWEINPDCNVYRAKI